MKKGKVVALFMAAILVLSACGNSTTTSSTPDSSTTAPRPEKRYVIGTASTSGAHYAIATGMADMINKESDYLRLTPQATEGGDANGILVSKGELDFGFWTVEGIYNSVYALGDIAPADALTNLKGVMTVQSNTAHFIARNDSGIQTMQDVRGKRMGMSKSSITERLTRAILDYYDINWYEDLARGDITSVDDIREKLSDGDLDIIYIGGAPPLGSVIELMSEGNYRLISIPPEDLEEIIVTEYEGQAFASYSVNFIPAGVYPNQDYDVYAAAVRNLIFCGDFVPEDDVYEFLRINYEHWDTIKMSHSAITYIDWNNFPDTRIPLHPGAEKFYREKELLK